MHTLRSCNWCKNGSVSVLCKLLRALEAMSFKNQWIYLKPLFYYIKYQTFKIKPKGQQRDMFFFSFNIDNYCGGGYYTSLEEWKKLLLDLVSLSDCQSANIFLSALNNYWIFFLHCDGLSNNNNYYRKHINLFHMLCLTDLWNFWCCCCLSLPGPFLSCWTACWVMNTPLSLEEQVQFQTCVEKIVIPFSVMIYF